MKKRHKYLGEDGVIRYPDGREVCDMTTMAGRAKYRERKLKTFLRQGGVCALQISQLCQLGGGRLYVETFELDHQEPKGMGGADRDDRIVIVREGKTYWHNAAVCPMCNSVKGSRRLPYHFKFAWHYEPEIVVDSPDAVAQTIPVALDPPKP